MRCGWGVFLSSRWSQAALLLAALACAVCGFARPVDAGQQAPSAATASVSGKLSVATGGGVTNNLAGIPVKLTPGAPGSTPQTAVTDADGYFTFPRLVPGTYSLEAIVDGFKPWTAAVTLAAGQAATQDASLELNLVTEQVEVKGEATEIATQSVSAAATVSDQALETLPLRTGKFTEALSVSPSVIRTQEGRLNFNGQAESQGMLLVDSAENVDPVSGNFAIPIPVDAIQSIEVFSTPNSAEFGGFSGGLTTIDLKPPPAVFRWNLLDFVPSFRGKNDSLVGLANLTPRLEFGGPVIKDKVNAFEEMTYEYRRDPVRGLTWPYNETYVRSFDSFTEVQVTLSAKHLMNMNLNVFPADNSFTNISALIPQTASTNYRRRGFSTSFSDAYQFASGLVLDTIVRYTLFDSQAYGQGTAPMTISPEGWGGNFFNAWARKSNQLEAYPSLQLPERTWHGTHELKFGADVLYRTYTGTSTSQPIELLAEAGTVAEQINFQGAGVLSASDVELAGYGQDKWSLTSALSLSLGARFTTQTIGRDLGFAPRAGLAYNWADARTVLRGGAGLIYGHVPLLASDFADNLTRVITFSSGPFVGQPITLQNIYVPTGSNGGTPGRDNLANSPRTFTWSLETETQVTRNLNLRVGYFETHTTDLFLVNPVLPTLPATNGFLELQNIGSSHYREAQAIIRYRPGERAEVNISYSWSRARGDLNTLSDTFIPFEAPVLRRNVYGVLPSDIPNRVLAWGFMKLPWKMVFSPVVDVHSGFPYSNVDDLQRYVGAPNTHRFPEYFSMDVKLYREFTIHVPYKKDAKRRKVRLGVYSLNVTNHQNPHDVFNNTTSPIFGEFAGFQRRFTGVAVDLGH
jgi:hypothetical protein